jgi:xylulokinase
LTPRADWAEQDAEQVWQLALEALAQAVEQSRADPPRAMALSVQGEAVIPVDGAGRPIRNAILGMDTRSSAENAWLAETFDPQVLFHRTGMPMHTINTITKLLWLKRNEPQVWASAEQFLLYEDYFLRRLTGKAVISHCLASRTQMYDLHTSNWAADILDRCDLDPGRLAQLSQGPFSVPSGQGRVGLAPPSVSSSPRKESVGQAGPQTRNIAFGNPTHPTNRQLTTVPRRWSARWTRSSRARSA